jgi:hypothetical protein
MAKEKFILNQDHQQQSGITSLDFNKSFRSQIIDERQGCDSDSKLYPKIPLSDYKQKENQFPTSGLQQDGRTRIFDGSKADRSISFIPLNPLTVNTNNDAPPIHNIVTDVDSYWAMMERYCSPEDKTSWEGFHVPNVSAVNQIAMSTFYTPAGKIIDDAQLRIFSNRSTSNFTNEPVSDTPHNLISNNEFHTAQKSILKSTATSKYSFKSAIPELNETFNHETIDLAERNSSQMLHNISILGPESCFTTIEPDTGTSPFNTFRHNSTSIALNETQTYLDRIKELECKLQVAEERVKMETSLRFDFEQRMKTLVTEVRFADQTCLEECARAQNLQIQFDKTKEENDQLKNMLREVSLKQRHQLNNSESREAQASDLSNTPSMSVAMSDEYPKISIHPNSAFPKTPQQIAHEYGPSLPVTQNSKQSKLLEELSYFPEISKEQGHDVIIENPSLQHHGSHLEEPTEKGMICAKTNMEEISQSNLPLEAKNSHVSSSNLLDAMRELDQCCMGKQNINNTLKLESQLSVMALNIDQGVDSEELQTFESLKRDLEISKTLLLSRQSEIDNTMKGKVQAELLEAELRERLISELNDKNEKLSILQDEIVSNKESAEKQILLLQAELKLTQKTSMSEESIKQDFSAQFPCPTTQGNLPDNSPSSRRNDEKLQLAKTIQTLLQVVEENFDDLEERVGKKCNQFNLRLNLLSDMVGQLKTSVHFYSESDVPESSYQELSESCAHRDGQGTSHRTIAKDSSSNDLEGQHSTYAKSNTLDKGYKSENMTDMFALDSIALHESRNYNAETGIDNKDISIQEKESCLLFDDVSVLSASVISTNDDCQKHNEANLAQHIQWLARSPLFDPHSLKDGSAQYSCAGRMASESNCITDFTSLPSISVSSTIERKRTIGGDILISQDAVLKETFNDTNKLCTCKCTSNSIAIDNTVTDLDRQTVEGEILHDASLSQDEGILKNFQISKEQFNTLIRIMSGNELSRQIKSLQEELSATTNWISQAKTSMEFAFASNSQLMTSLHLLNPETKALAVQLIESTSNNVDLELQGKLVCDSLSSSYICKGKQSSAEKKITHAKTKGQDCLETSPKDVIIEKKLHLSEQDRELLQTQINDLNERNAEVLRIKQEDDAKLLQQLKESMGSIKVLSAENVELADLVDEKEETIKTLSTEIESYILKNHVAEVDLQSIPDLKREVSQLRNNNNVLTDKCKRLQDFSRKLAAKCDQWQKLHEETQVKYEKARQKNNDITHWNQVRMNCLY